MGRPKFVPTDEHRHIAKSFAGYGIQADDIAAYLGIRRNTLFKYFKHDMQEGRNTANAKVAQSLFNMATKRNNVAAAIFWAKTRMGWREKVDVEVSGGPLVAVIRTGDG